MGEGISGFNGHSTVYVALIMIAIIYASAFRFFGIAYSQYTIPFIEYGFLFILFLGSPWLV